MFDYVYNDYIGSADIIKNEKLRKWISWASKYEDSTNRNIRSVAYMLDTDVWNVYAGKKSEYAIGGPTLEMFIDSYNNTHDEKLECKETTSVGYKVKKGDESYNNSVSGLTTNKEMNSLYVILDWYSSAAGMWIASPSATEVNQVMQIFYNGTLRSDYIYNTYNAFPPGLRPVVCLHSDVILNKVGENYQIQYKN